MWPTWTVACSGTELYRRASSLWSTFVAYVSPSCVGLAPVPPIATLLGDVVAQRSLSVSVASSALIQLPSLGQREVAAVVRDGAAAPRGQEARVRQLERALDLFAQS